ncbi:MAG: hypothetical protein CMJ85_06100 [Planctomycetes bacterium]|nr:hypothetical protein [Planctomycetota bacterium]
MGEDAKRIRHTTYGEGTVTRVERGGLSLRVLFDKFPGLEVSLPTRLLRCTESAGGGVVAAPKAKEHAPLDLDAMQRHQVLEAIRLGVVPMQGLLAYTVGRDEEVDRFHGMLEAASTERVAALLGDYGSGKTHMLELMQHLALEAGWVVGRAWLDPQEAPPSKPRRVYSALARSFIYPDRREAGESGIWPMLERAAQVADLQGGLDDAEGRPHAFLSPAIRYARGLIEATEKRPGSRRLVDLTMQVASWIEGRATGVNTELQRSLHQSLTVRDRVLALSDFGTLPRVYGYLLSGLGVLARRCGYRGLCVMLDETELFSSLDLEERARAVDVFRVLMGAALPKSGAQSLDLTEVRKGGRGIIRDLPPRFGEDSDLVLALAATPGSASEDFLRTTLGGDRVMELGRFSSSDYRLMGDRILDLYLQAHTDMSRRVLAALEAKMDQWLAQMLHSPREFGRRVVDFLDQCRHAVVEFG